MVSEWDFLVCSYFVWFLVCSYLWYQSGIGLNYHGLIVYDQWDFLVCSYLWYQIVYGIRVVFLFVLIYGLNSFMGVYGSRDGIRVVLGLTRSWEYHLWFKSGIRLNSIMGVFDTSWECSKLRVF
jgi:hypothetical protein